MYRSDCLLKENNTIAWPTWPQYGEEEKEAVKRVIDSNQLFAADRVREFEDNFKSYTGTSFAKGVGNATQGLHLAMAALDIGIGDEVIVTPYTFIASASSILMQNAVPVFCDCDPQTRTLSAEKIARHLSHRTRAIVVVHMFGYPADMDPIMELAQKHGLSVIEDASHAYGAEYKGRRCGGIGDVGVFSMHQRKSLSAGDGGVVTTNDPEIDEKIYRLRSFGHKQLSYNYRMTEFAGALGLIQLRKLDTHNQVRQDNAELLERLLEDIEGLDVIKPLPCAKSVYYRVLLHFDREKFNCDLEEFSSQVQDSGVPLEMTWKLLHKHPHFNPEKVPARGLPWEWSTYDGVMKGKKYNSLSFPIIENLCDNHLLELCVHPPVSEGEIAFAVRTIAKAAEKFSK